MFFIIFHNNSYLTRFFNQIHFKTKDIHYYIENNLYQKYGDYFLQLKL